MLQTTGSLFRYCWNLPKYPCQEVLQRTISEQSIPRQEFLLWLLMRNVAMVKQDWVMLHSCSPLEPVLMSIWGSHSPHLGATHAWELNLTLGKEVGRNILSTWNSEEVFCRQNFVLQMGIWHGCWGGCTDISGKCQKSFNDHLWTRSQFKCCLNSRVESPVQRHSFQADTEQRMPPPEWGQSLSPPPEPGSPWMSFGGV